MKCRHCSSKNTRVTVTEGKKQITVRYCRCLDCGGRFKTIERYAQSHKGIRKGCEHANSFLEPHNIVWIRSQHKAGFTNAEIARELKINSSIVSKIVTGKTYREVS